MYDVCTDILQWHRALAFVCHSAPPSSRVFLPSPLDMDAPIARVGVDSLDQTPRRRRQIARAGFWNWMLKGDHESRPARGCTSGRSLRESMQSYHLRASSPSIVQRAPPPPPSSPFSQSVSRHADLLQPRNSPPSVNSSSTGKDRGRNQIFHGPGDGATAQRRRTSLYQQEQDSRLDHVFFQTAAVGSPSALCNRWPWPFAMTRQA